MNINARFTLAVLIACLLSSGTPAHGQSDTTILEPSTPEARHNELLESSISFLREQGFKYVDSNAPVSTKGFRRGEQKFACAQKRDGVTFVAKLSKVGKGSCVYALAISGREITKRDIDIFAELASRMVDTKSKASRKELAKNADDTFGFFKKNGKAKHASDWFALPADAHAKYKFTITPLESELVLIDFSWTTALLKKSASNLSPNGNKRPRSLDMVAWNVESGGNDPLVIAKQLKDFAGCDIVALNEVGRRNVPAYAAALGDHFQVFVSKSGRADHLAIFFNSKRFVLLEQKEMTRHGDYLLNNGTHRSPIYVRLKERKSGQEFIFMTNHLARRDENLRRRQAAGLREWARDSNTPIIAMGDFNFDYSFKKQRGNQSFNVFMRDNVWKWVKPDPLIDTNWSGGAKDNYPDSMLDFAFVANGAKSFESVCKIIVRPGDFPDSDRTSDHRATRLKVGF